MKYCLVFLLLSVLAAFDLVSAHRGGGGRGGRGGRGGGGGPRPPGGGGGGGGDGDGAGDDCELSERDVEKVRDDLRPLLVGRLSAHMLRAVFHDSVGGSDGCMNRDVSFNSGFPGPENFMNVVGVLDNLYDVKYSESSSCLSRADFYVLAGEVAVENAFVRAQKADCNCTTEAYCRKIFNRKMDLGFKYGREDCPTSPITDDIEDFPLGHFNAAEVFGFFEDMYGMDVEESVAIMGAHTMGRATGFSGWRGIWVEDEEEEIEFDNIYYDSLVDPEIDFVQVTNTPDFVNGDGLVEARFQWNGTEIEDGEEEIYLMLNADMALLKDIQTDAEGRSSCTFDSCADSVGAPFVRRFAVDNDAFFVAFSRAWRKMVTAGAGGELREPRRSSSSGGGGGSGGGWGWH